MEKLKQLPLLQVSNNDKFEKEKDFDSDFKQFNLTVYIERLHTFYRTMEICLMKFVNAS